jgi:hypothetical protein
LPRDEHRLLINAYNAGMVLAILQANPGPSSVAPKSSALKPGGGKERTLDGEHEILRRRFHEPRIHFAIVCASTSCPKLRREAYRAASLDAQLDAQAREFINDPQRNVFLPAEGKMRLSKIFDWFRDDFEKRLSLAVLSPYVDDAATRQWLQSMPPSTSTSRIRLTLNAQPQRPRPPER